MIAQKWKDAWYTALKAPLLFSFYWHRHVGLGLRQLGELR